MVIDDKKYNYRGKSIQHLYRAGYTLYFFAPVSGIAYFLTYYCGYNIDTPHPSLDILSKLAVVAFIVIPLKFYTRYRIIRILGAVTGIIILANTVLFILTVTHWFELDAAIALFILTLGLPLFAVAAVIFFKVYRGFKAKSV